MKVPGTGCKAFLSVESSPHTQLCAEASQGVGMAVATMQMDKEFREWWRQTSHTEQVMELRCRLGPRSEVGFLVNLPVNILSYH